MLPENKSGNLNAKKYVTFRDDWVTCRIGAYKNGTLLTIPANSNAGYEFTFTDMSITSGTPFVFAHRRVTNGIRFYRSLQYGCGRGGCRI